jgi:hypothetical protein
MQGGFKGMRNCLFANPINPSTFAAVVGSDLVDLRQAHVG